jgi:nitrite reductase/ring-hydroxylating ferredoxin subunit
MTLTPRLTPTTPPVPNRYRDMASPPPKIYPNVWIPSGFKISDIPSVNPSRVSADEFMSPQCKRLHRQPSSPHRSEHKCGITVRVNEEDIALFRIAPNDRMYASHAQCPHMGAHLVQGGRILIDDIEDIAIECPLHKLRFDLKTGKLLTNGNSDHLKSFPVRVMSDGSVEIGFESMVLLTDNF